MRVVLRSVAKRQSAGVGVAGVSLAVLALIAWGAAAQAPVDLKAGPTAVLAIESALNDLGDELHIHVRVINNGARSSTIVFAVQFDPDTLAFDETSVVTGQGAADAGKGAEANLADVGEVRFIVSGFNTNVIANGEVASAVFKVYKAGAAASLYLEGVDPSIADPDGNEVAVRLVYFAPADVSVSRGADDKALVTWDLVPGAAAYQVYRSQGADPASAEPAGDWVEAPPFLDTATRMAAAQAAGCAGPLVGINAVYYWVRARNPEGREGALNATPALVYTMAKRQGQVASIGTAGFVGDLLMWAAVLAGIGVCAAAPRRAARRPGQR